MANLVELFDNIVQMQNLNGVPLAAGKLYVYALGRTRLMDSWSDVDGESLNPNPIILDDAGQAHVYVSDDFDYTLVVCDQYNNEIFSLDKYLYSEGSHSHADVAVAPSEHIGVSSYHVGEVTVYVPYLTGEVGKVYEGIDPIVVNNDVNRISANHIPLGVQDPLYFVEDSETACIIGCSAQTEIPTELSSKWDEASDTVIANSAQWSEGTTYEAGSYISIDDNTISVTGLQPEGDYAYNSALSSKLDVTALPQDLVHSGDLTAYQPVGNYQTAGNYLSATDSANFYPINNPSGFITGVDLTDYATTAQLDEKLDKTDSGNFYPMEGNPSGFLTAHQSLQGYATEDWVTGQGYLTAHQSLDGLMSADLLEISDNKITGYNGTAFAGQGGGVSGDFELSAGSGISIVDYPLEQKTVISVTAQGGNPEVEQAVIDNSATWNTVSNKLDTTAFSDVSGTFLTAHQDLSDYQTIAGMTAYQEAGNYLSSNALDELSGNWETVTAKQDSLTFGYHDTAISSIDNSALYDNSAHARINTLAGRISDLSSNKLDTTAFSDVSGTFLTAHQSLADYQTTAGMTAYQPIGDYVQGSDLSLNSYDKISAISGHEIAGGGGSVDFDYDSDGNISGINSSAIRYPSAEQLLPYPMEFVTNISDATGANILYVVTGE